MEPPVHITPEIIQLTASVSEKLGLVKGLFLSRIEPQLRKENRIRTIHGSLAIEGNTLSMEQVTALMENKKVIGPLKDIREVENARALYDQLSKYDPFSEKDFLRAHAVLMNGLIDRPGKYRMGNVGIVKQGKVDHLAPPAGLVPGLIKDLFHSVKKSKLPLLIRSCIFHYETEFIHPFSDGNGRMGRFWQTCMLASNYNIFEFLPIESLIKHKQQAYYQSLSASDKAGQSAPFVLFMLTIIDETLDEWLNTRTKAPLAPDRILLFQQHIGTKEFTRKEYLNYFKTLSTATASRDLKQASIQLQLEKKGDKSQAVYRFIHSLK